MKSRFLAALFLGTAAAVSLATPTSALGTRTFYATLTGRQEVPPVTTSGIGEATITLDDVTGAVTVVGSFSGLTSTCTLAHIHGPAAPGVNAGILVTLTETGGTSGTIGGGGTLAPADITNMINGLTYVNLHTTINGGGELRGQVTTSVPAMPWRTVGVLALLAVAGGAFLVARRPSFAVA